MDIKKGALSFFASTSLFASGYSRKYRANLKQKGELDISYYG